MMIMLQVNVVQLNDKNFQKNIFQIIICEVTSFMWEESGT